MNSGCEHQFKYLDGEIERCQLCNMKQVIPREKWEQFIRAVEEVKTAYHIDNDTDTEDEDNDNDTEDNENHNPNIVNIFFYIHQYACLFTLSDCENEVMECFLCNQFRDMDDDELHWYCRDCVFNIPNCRNRTMKCNFCDEQIAMTDAQFHEHCEHCKYTISK